MSLDALPACSRTLKKLVSECIIAASSWRHTGCSLISMCLYVMVPPAGLPAISAADYQGAPILARGLAWQSQGPDVLTSQSGHVHKLLSLPRRADVLGEHNVGCQLRRQVKGPCEVTHDHVVQLELALAGPAAPEAQLLSPLFRCEWLGFGSDRARSFEPCVLSKTAPSAANNVDAPRWLRR